MDLPDRVLRTIRRHDLVPRGGRVLVALSGGPDSVALVHLLLELQRAGELAVVALAHFNHQLRGEAADADERFCCALAADLSLPFDVGRADVRAIARAEHRSLEDAARVSRYAFLEAAASRARAEVVAVGHTRDDQAETFLLRLIRGAGARGLAGIHPRAGRVVRPLIDVRRAELRAYLAKRQLAFCEDATNDDVGIPRNRVRHELLPYLAREFSPNIVEVLAREAAIAREDEDRLQAEAIELLRTVVLRDSGSDEDPVEIDAAALRALPPALASRVAREVLARVAPRRFSGSEHVLRLLELARGVKPRDAVSLPGVRAVRRGDRILLGSGPPAPFSNSFRFPLSIPGEVLLDKQGWAVSATSPQQATAPGGQTPVLYGGQTPVPYGGQTPVPYGGQTPVPYGGQTPVQGAGQTGGGNPREPLHAIVRADAVKLPLAVRSRRPGDRFRPLGMGGRGRKLQDFFVDRKIPRETRDLLPLVVDADDRIVWVVGQGVGEEFRVTELSQAVILLIARRLGGPG